MTRKIKFRAWDSFTKKMNEITRLKLPHREDLSPGLVLMQFTGLHDKNGVEIYENDLAKQLYTEGEEVMRCLWKENGWVWVGKDDGVSGSWNGEDFEVVGNIYQNPELLTN